MGNMSAPEDLVSEPMKDITNNEGESNVEGKKRQQQSYRQKMQAVSARMKYREKLIKGFRQHLQKGTFPKRFKSLKPYPKMDTPESQAILNVACQQAESVILDQMLLDEECKLEQDQATCQSLKEERQNELSKAPRLSVVQLKQELADLQAKYNELCGQLDSQIVTGM